jgi:hypothetical protein
MQHGVESTKRSLVRWQPHIMPFATAPLVPDLPLSVTLAAPELLPSALRTVLDLLMLVSSSGDLPRH